MKVTVDNFARAETHNYFASHMREAGGLGRFMHIYVRLYRPRPEILEGRWQFPAPVPVL